MNRPASLRLRLTLGFSLLAAVVFALAGVLIHQAVDRHFIEQDLDLLQGELGLVRGLLASVRSSEELTAAGVRLGATLVGHHHGLLLGVTRSEGSTVFASDHLHGLPPLPVQGDLPVLQRWDAGEMPMRGFAGTANTAIPGEPPLRVVVATDIVHHEQFLAAFRHSLIAVILASIVLIAVLAWWMARRALQPIPEIAALAQRISAAQLDPRLVLDRVPQELQQLAEAFNAMLARLQDSFMRLSDFSSDIAHELRTPISNLMMQTQVSLTRLRTPEEYREILFSNLEEYERLARMVADMLYLAKSDNQQMVPARESISLGRQLAELGEYFEPLASERGLRLRIDGEASVMADRLMIRRALANLLSNAIRHAAADSEILLATGTDAAGAVWIKVENAGATIPAEHLPRLFDRFYRVDAARSREAEGVGLGLAITRAIAQAHGGEVSVSSADGHTRFVISLPASHTQNV